MRLSEIKEVRVTKNVDEVNFLLSKGYVLLDIFHMNSSLGYLLGTSAPLSRVPNT